MEENMNNLFNEAVAFAVEKHSNQKRKCSAWPYVVHLYDVMQILQQNDANLETIIAGILHDTVEDTNTTLDEIESKFGTNIRNMVDIVTEKKNLPYIERKLIQAQRLKNAPIQAKMVKCADCLSNLSSIKYDLTTDPNTWDKFNAPKQNIKIHYAETIKAMAELENLDMYKQLKSIYKEVFSERLIEKAINHYCNDCTLLKRVPAPDPHDWLCDDNEIFVCKMTNEVLSEGNRPYEKQPTPDNCPLLNNNV